LLSTRTIPHKKNNLKLKIIMSEKNGVMMQFFHWYTPNDGSLWNQLSENAETLAEAGITSVWLPPAYKGSNGGFDTGYGV